MPETLAEFMAEGVEPAGQLSLDDFMSEGAADDPAAPVESLDDFMAEGAPVEEPESPAAGTWESFGMPSRDDQIAADEQAAGEAGQSVFDLNKSREAESNYEGTGMAGRLFEDAGTAAAEAISVPVATGLGALGWDAAGEAAENTLARRDVRSAREKGTFEKHASGITQSIAKAGALGATGGMPAIMSGLGANSYIDSHRQALNEGKTEEEAGKIALANAAWEVGVMSIFNRIGLGGAEKAVLNTAAVQGVKKFATQTLAELGEEQVTNFAQSMASTGEMPTLQSAVDTTIQTVGTMGLLGGVQKVREFVEKPNYKTAKALGIEKVYPSQQKRLEVAAKIQEGMVEDAAPVDGGEIDGEFEVAGEQLRLPAPEPQQDSQPPAEPVVPSPTAAGVVPKSTLQFDAMAGTAARVVRNGKRWIKQNFQSGGEQNEATRKLLYERDGVIRGHLAELSQNSSSLQAAVRKAYNIPRMKQVPETVSAALDAALKDQSQMAALPTDVAVELQKMRDHVDGLSKTIQSMPDVGEELQLSIDKNMGQYITRTYRKFGDTDGWARKALGDKQIMADFAAEVRQSSPDATDDEVSQLAEILLRRNTTSMSDLGRFTPRTNKFVNVLKSRKDLSPAVRKLYGERTDAFENYTETVGKLSNLVAHRQFVEQLKTEGQTQGFFSTVDAPKPGHVQQVNTNLPQLKPLEGMLTTPELADAINDIYTTHTPGKFERVYLASMGLSKAAKTVGSLQATIRNFTGNIPIAMANGAWSPKQLAGAAKATWWTDLFNKGDAASKAEIRSLHELGMIEGVTVEALRDIAARTSASIEDYIAGVDSRNHFKNVTRGAAKVYQSMDTVWKIHTFYSYLPQYRDAHPEMSDQELRMHVARIVRDITPTYSEASNAAKFWSRYMPVGPFAMFNAEMWRTTANRIRLTKEELQSGNPALQKLAAKRVAGQAAALGMASAAAMVAKHMIGMSDDEEEALRQRVAPWQKNSVIIPVSKDPKTGQFEYFDASYNDPFSVFTNPLVALSRGEAKESIAETAEPFVSEDLTIGAIMSIMRNQDANGRRVYDPGQLPGQQWKEIAQYALQQFEPGTITSARRIARAAKGQTSSSGKKYSLGNEIASVAAGVRLDTVDRAQSDFYRNQEFEARVQDSQRSIRKLFLGQGSFDAAKAADLYPSAESSRKQSLTDWREYVDGSILLGETRPYAKVASDIGAESAIMKMMYSKQYRPYQFPPADMAKMRRLPDGESRVQLYRDLYRDIAAPQQPQE